MSTGVVRDLVAALQSGHVRSMVLVPSEQPATLHVFPTPEGGWEATMQCRRVMCDLLRAVVANSAAGDCELTWHNDNSVGVSIHVEAADLMRRLLDVVVDDHIRTSPGTRLAAILTEDDDCAPRRMEIVRPLAPKPQYAAAQGVVSLSARLSRV